MKKKLVVIPAFVLLACACGNKLSGVDFLKTISKDEAFVKILKLEKFNIKCSFLPSAFMAIQETIKQSGELAVDPVAVGNAQKKYDNAFYFNYAIASEDGKSIVTQLAHNQQEYAYVISELTYNMHTMLYLVRDNKDTIRSLTYNYDNLYSSGNTLNFLFAFPKSEACEKLDLVFDDKLLGTGSKAVISYKFKDLIKKLPEIKDI